MARTSVENGPHPVDRHVGRRVAERRISLGFNQSDLGRALGLTFQQIQKYEKGTNRISASKLWDTAAFLSVEINYFFEGLGDFAVDDNDPAAKVAAPTRQSIEIARLAPRLTRQDQKLALELIRSMAGAASEAD